MTHRFVVENKISAVKKYLNTLQRYKKYSAKEIKEDVDICGAVEHYLYLAVQATIDLADAYIALKEYRKPTTMSENFDILQEEGVIDLKLTEQLVKMTGFRNIIAHNYEKIDYNVVHDILHNRTKDIRKFLRIIEQR